MNQTLKMAIIGGIVVIAGITGYFVLNQRSLVEKSAPISNLSPDTTHPVSTFSSQIAEIDKIKDDTDKLINNGGLQEKKKEFGYSEPYKPVLKAIYIDGSGKILKYVQEAGSDDSTLSSNFYYDQNNKLRFVLMTGGAVNGSELEHKIYFDKNGGRISELHQYLKGPGYTFPSIWPESEIVVDPLKEFNSSSIVHPK